MEEGIPKMGKPTGTLRVHWNVSSLNSRRRLGISPIWCFVGNVDEYIRLDWVIDESRVQNNYQHKDV